MCLSVHMNNASLNNTNNTAFIVLAKHDPVTDPMTWVIFACCVVGFSLCLYCTMHAGDICAPKRPKYTKYNYGAFS